MTAIVDIARGYLGTPFVHQGRLPSVGLDCAGVAVCALRELGHEVQDVQGYGRIPSQGTMTTTIEKHCDKIKLEDVQAGDFMAFAFRSDTQHIAIVSSINPIMIIHAYSEVRMVVENSFDKTWQDRLRGCYRLRVA